MMHEQYSKIRVLVIEDNPGDADLFETFFTQSGRQCEFKMLFDGEAALRFFSELAQKGESRPHIIILDINIPKVDGKEVLKAIKENPKIKAIPVIVLTSSDNEDDVAYCYDHGANCVLNKAYDLESATELFSTLEKFWINTVRLASDNG